MADSPPFSLPGFVWDPVYVYDLSLLAHGYLENGASSSSRKNHQLMLRRLIHEPAVQSIYRGHHHSPEPIERLFNLDYRPVTSGTRLRFSIASM